MTFLGVRQSWPYVFGWGLGIASLLVVAAWFHRFRGGIPLTPIERQLAQVWYLALAGFLLTGVINHLMGLEPFKLLPVVVLECGVAFGCMAAILGGEFYLPAGLCAILALILVKSPSAGPLLFGTTFLIGLFLPAWKYARWHKERREDQERFC
jgi:eukaryotic-like serine/threonine-protein kinase